MEGTWGWGSGTIQRMGNKGGGAGTGGGGGNEYRDEENGEGTWGASVGDMKRAQTGARAGFYLLSPSRPMMWPPALHSSLALEAAGEWGEGVLLLQQPCISN
ncbi:hypothetical protein V8E53_013848 [Lactarius tabidus]